MRHRSGTGNENLTNVGCTNNIKNMNKVSLQQFGLPTWDIISSSMNDETLHSRVPFKDRWHILCYIQNSGSWITLHFSQPGSNVSAKGPCAWRWTLLAKKRKVWLSGYRCRDSGSRGDVSRSFGWGSHTTISESILSRCHWIVSRIRWGSSGDVGSGQVTPASPGWSRASSGSAAKPFVGWNGGGEIATTFD